MSDRLWVRRGSKIHGPYSKQQIKIGIKSGQVLQSDELAQSDTGPWKTVADAVQPSSKQKNALSTSESPPSAKAVSSNLDAPTPLASQSDQLDSSKQLVHQLDFTHFLVEGMAQQQVFENLKQAAARNHTVNGAFLKSGLIRGTGNSGIEFIVKVEQADEGVSFHIDGSTPDGPADFGVLFNPFSLEGWGMAGAVGLFNSLVNNSVANSVENDVSLLIVNLLDSLGAADLVTGNQSGTVDSGALEQKLKALPNIEVTSIEHNRLTTNFPNESLIPAIYQLLKDQERNNSPNLVHKIGFGLTSRNDLIENVTLMDSGEGVIANVPDGKGTWIWTLTVAVSEPRSGRSELSVNVTCNAPSILDLGGYVKKRCIKQAEIIRNLIAVDLKTKMQLDHA